MCHRVAVKIDPRQTFLHQGAQSFCAARQKITSQAAVAEPIGSLHLPATALAASLPHSAESCVTQKFIGEEQNHDSTG